MKQYAVYDLLAHDKLIYVGMSHNPEQRLSQHKHKRTVPDFATVQVVSWHEKRSEALDVEKARITDLRPPLNTVLCYSGVGRSERIDQARQYARTLYGEEQDRRQAEHEKWLKKWEADAIAQAQELHRSGVSVDEITAKWFHFDREVISSWVDGRPWRECKT